METLIAGQGNSYVANFFFFFENLLRPCTLDETLNLSTPHFLVCKMDFLQILALNEMM